MTRSTERVCNGFYVGMVHPLVLPRVSRLLSRNPVQHRPQDEISRPVSPSLAQRLAWRRLLVFSIQRQIGARLVIARSWKCKGYQQPSSLEKDT